MKSTGLSLSQLKIIRFFTAQLIAFCLLILLLTQNIFAWPLVMQICYGLIAIATVILNYVFVKEITSSEGYDDRKMIVRNQFIFIIVFLVLAVFGFYRGITAVVIYRQIIGYCIGAFGLIFALLMIWGLKYAKLKQNSSR